MSKMNFRSHSIGFVSGFLLLLGAVPISGAQGGEQDCSDLVANHTYIQGFGGFANLGLLNQGAPVVPNAGAGFVKFLPGGKWTAHYTIATGMLATFPDVPINGDYALFVDTAKTPALCTGTMTGTAVYGPPLGTLDLNFQLTVIEQGKRIEMIHTDPALIVGVTGYVLHARGCNNNTVDGKYSNNVKGWGLGQPSGPLSFPPEQLLGGYFPFAFSGGLQFLSSVPPRSEDFPDSLPGSSSVLFWDGGSINGSNFQRTGIGWYKLNQDCTGITVLRDSLGNPDFHLKIFAGNSGKSLYLVNVDTVAIQGLPAPVPAFILGMSLNQVDQEED